MYRPTVTLTATLVHAHALSLCSALIFTPNTTQGMMINLSLSEMAQFFMKMATAIKKKKLKPGKSIPGLNSYFLCRYLKDTMLQARTYLFCAIRPEASYLKYTFSTLGFAKNASVIKLSPKKATTMATPAERKLMRQLDEMKAMMEALQKKNENPVSPPRGGRTLWCCSCGLPPPAALWHWMVAAHPRVRHRRTGANLR